MEKVKSFPWILSLSIMFLSYEGTKFSSASVTERLQTIETKLYNQLLSSYNKHVRPVFDAEYAVHINISITLANVIGIDEKRQSLTTLLWIHTEWMDPFLSWNKTDFPGISHFVIPANKIWTPDLMVNNAIGTTIPSVSDFLEKSEGADISPSGKVFHLFSVLLNSVCPISIELFPFDFQSCPIVLASWIHDNSQIKLSPSKDAARVGTSQWDLSKSWIVTNFTASKSVYHFNTRSYDHVDFSITLKRKSTFFVINLLVPCYLISIIACLCYAIPPQGSDRISLLLTTFLAILVFVIVVSDIVPAESDTVPLFSKFLLMVMLLNMLQLFYCTFVCGINTMDQICLGPPKCLVTWARCMTSCLCGPSHKKDTKLNTSRQTAIQLDLQKKVSSSVESKIAGLQQSNREDIQDRSNNDVHVEINPLKGNADIATGTTPKTDYAGDKKTKREENIKRWRVVLKAVDVLLFILNFLGLTGYFIAILVIYY